VGAPPCRTSTVGGFGPYSRSKVDSGDVVRPDVAGAGIAVSERLLRSSAAGRVSRRASSRWAVIGREASCEGICSLIV
jgi:hypothetical protein